ncbi:1,3-beta-glucanosyltransferase GAS1 [Microdochium nivale]|nr:1,3-beta-glucanosyltransferase GAS1 [Microdochium nivale]
MEPVTISGNHFYRGNSRFLLNGVVYQLHHVNPEATTAGATGSTRDPLAEENLGDLQRCLPLFRELELNTLFIYWFDPSKNHDAAMALLAEAGIYVLALVANPHLAISRERPLESYGSPTTLEHYFRVVDVMSRYTNTLGLLVGNEVINDMESTQLVPSVLRALTRDLKQYMRMCAEIDDGDAVDGGQSVDDDYAPQTIPSRGKSLADGTAPTKIDANSSASEHQQQCCHKLQRRRVLPLGYSASDVIGLLQATFNYLVAGPEEDALDFFGFNKYSWVGEASIQIAGWDTLARSFSQSPVPVFMSEYGAQIGQPRIFQETRALYSPAMTGALSGGIVYEMFEGSSRYGLVSLRRLPAGGRKGKWKQQKPEKQDQSLLGKETWATEGRLRKREVRDDSHAPLGGEEGEDAGAADDSDDDENGGGESVEVLQKRRDFENLRQSLVSCRAERNPPPLSSTTTAAAGADAGAGAAVVAERPSFPPTGHHWRATSNVPACPLDWADVRAQIVADREWVDVAAEFGVV